MENQRDIMGTGLTGRQEEQSSPPREPDKTSLPQDDSGEQARLSEQAIELKKKQDKEQKGTPETNPVPKNDTGEAKITSVEPADEEEDRQVEYIESRRVPEVPQGINPPPEPIVQLQNEWHKHPKERQYS